VRFESVVGPPAPSGECGDLVPLARDASFGVVRELHERLAPLSDEARRKVLGLNARRFYRLSG